MARLHGRLSHHQADYLAHMLHGVLRKDDLVASKRGQHVVPRNIGGQHHIHHTGHGQGGAAVHAAQMAVRHGRQNRGGKQGAAHLGHVVDVGDSAGHLRAGAFMRRAGACSAFSTGVLGHLR
jgi:hypothetical protein